MDVVKIKRKCKPGEKNVNGVTYDLESYNKAIEKFNERIKHGMPIELFVCKHHYQYMDRLKRQGYYFIDPENCCGKIIEVTDDYIVVEPNSLWAGNILKDLIDKGIEISAHMRYTSNSMTNPTKIINIITFDIIIMEA